MPEIPLINSHLAMPHFESRLLVIKDIHFSYGIRMNGTSKINKSEIVKHIQLLILLHQIRINKPRN